VIDKGIFFLLIFTPLAVGSVQIWASAIMEIAAFSIFGVWLMKISSVKGLVFRDNGQGERVMAVLFGAFLTLIIMQITPLPVWLLRFLSSNTASFYERFTIEGSAEWRTLSIYPWATRQELLKLLSYAAVFSVIANYYRTREKTEALVRKIMVIAFSLVVFAIFQKLTWNGMLYWIYPLDGQVSSSKGFSVWGPFINRNHFAGYLEICIPLGLGMIFYSTAKTKASQHATVLKRFASVMSSKRFSSLGLRSVATFVMIGALFMTLSRGGIIGFLCSALFLIILARMRRRLRKKIIVPVFAGLLLLLMVIVAGWDRIEDRFEQLGEETSLKRAEVWADSAGIVKDYPLFGTGLGTFQNSYPQYQSHSSTTFYDHAHNDYIELLTDTGLAGFILGGALVVTFFSMLFSVWLKRHRTYTKAIGAAGMASLIAILVHSFADFNLHIPANAMLLAVVAGITYSVIMSREEEYPDINV
jgi:O-antigen ligase